MTLQRVLYLLAFAGSGLTVTTPAGHPRRPNVGMQPGLPGREREARRRAPRSAGAVAAGGAARP